MIGTPGAAARTAATMRLVGAITQRSNSASGSTPAQLSNSCTASDPGGDLAQQIGDCRLDQQVDQPAEGLGLAIGQALDHAVFLAAAALDHIGRHGPGRAREADQRRSRAAGPPPPARRSRRPAPAPRAAVRRTGGRCRPRRSPAPASGPRPRHSPAPGPARAAPPGCPRTGSPRPARSGGSAAASPRRPAPGCSRDRGSCRPGPGARGIPADSARPGASARPAAGPGSRRPGRAGTASPASRTVFPALPILIH